MVGKISEGIGVSVFDMLRSLREEQEETPTETAAGTLAAQTLEASAPKPLAARASSSNVMSGNFVSADPRDSRYLDAQFDSFKISTEMYMSQKSTMVSVLDAFGGIALPSLYDAHDNPKNGGGAIQEHKIRKYLEQKDTERLMEEMQEELREQKEEDRAEAAEALASGEVLDGRTSDAIEVAGDPAAPMPEVSGSTPAPAPMPEVSGATPAPAPEVSSASPSETAQVAGQAPEFFTLAASVTPTVKIKV